MKSDALFCNLKSKYNIKVLDANEKIKKQFKDNYSNLQDKLFYEVMENCGGFLFSKCDIEARDRKVISIDEIIIRNFEFIKKF